MTTPLSDVAIASKKTAAADSKSPGQALPLFNESLELQEYHLGRLERRIIFLKDRIDGKTKTHQISKINFEQRRQYEIYELNALLWAARELRKVIDTNRKLFIHFSDRFKEK